MLYRSYTASNMVLSAAGRVEHDRIVDLAEKHFGSVPRTPANAIAPTPLSYVGGDGRESRVLEQAHLVLGFPGVGVRDPDYWAVQVFATLLAEFRLGEGTELKLTQPTIKTAGTAPASPHASAAHAAEASTAVEFF